MSAVPHPGDDYRAGELAAASTTAARLIERRLRDARSHAEAGIMHDAGDRLDELAESLTGHLRASRRTFYRAAWEDQVKRLDPAIVRTDVAPSDDDTEAETAPIGGEDQASAIVDLIERARRELVLTTGIHQHKTDSNLMLPIAIGGWERRHRDALTAGMEMHLSDAQVCLYQAVGRLLVKPELR